MSLIAIIAVCLVAVWRLGTFDTPLAVSGLFGSGVFSIRWSGYIAAAGVVAGLLLLGNSLTDNLSSRAGSPSITALVILGASALCSLLITIRISELSSMCYALMGALLGWQSFRNGSLDQSYTLTLGASWVAAPLLAALLAWGLVLGMEAAFGKRQGHLLKRNLNIHRAMVVAAVMMLLAIGANNGPLAAVLAEKGLQNLDMSFVLPHIQTGSLFAAGVIAVLFVATPHKWQKTIFRFSDREFYVNAQSALVMAVAATVVLFFFSFGPLCGSLGLSPTPLSVPQLAFGALAGVGFARHRSTPDREKLFRAALTLVLAPAIAYGTAYLLLSLVDADMLISSSRLSAPHLLNLTLPLVVLAAIVVLALSLVYGRKQKKIGRKAHEKNIEQKNQLFENQKALTALEIKTVMLENESLSDKLELRRKELINIALSITEQKSFLEELYPRIKELQDEADGKKQEERIAELERMVRERMHFAQEVEGFYARVETLHKDFNLRLNQKFPNLSEQEIRLTTLLRLGFSTKHIAVLMNISPKSVEVGRYRLRAKLQLEREQNLMQFVKTI